MLSITSHHRDFTSTNSIIFHRSKPVVRLLPTPVQQELRFNDHGTRVAVNDLFGDMPVRVKSRALAFQKQDELEKEWDDLRQLLVSLMLASGKLTKLVVSDAGKNKKFMVRLPAEPPPSLNHDSVWGESELKFIRSVLNQAGIVGFENSDCWNTVSACLPDMSIHAAISLLPSPTKKAQFISLGSNPVFVRNNANALYSEVNRVFASSDFGTTSSLPEIGPSIQRASLAEHVEANTGVYSKWTSKGISKWPMFYIRINTRAPQKISDDGYEVVPESDKSLQHIIEVLSAMLTEFLKQHDLRPRCAKRKRNIDEVSRAGVSGEESQRSRVVARQEPLSRQTGSDAISSTEEAFDGHLKLPLLQRSLRTSAGLDSLTWSKIKSSRKNPLEALRTKRSGFSAAGPSYGENASPVVGTRSSVQASTAAAGSEGVEEPLGDDTKDTLISLTDLYTNRPVLVNSRTGNTVNPQSRSVTGDGRPQSTGSLPNTRRLSILRRPESANSAGQNTWVEGILKKWENPIFQRSERRISSANVEKQDGEGMSHHHHHQCFGDIFGMGASRFAMSQSKLWRRGLETAKVIGQVDRKFLLTKMGALESNDPNDHTESVLVLIDQHAADERCRVEQLYGALFTTERWDSQPGVVVSKVQTTQTEPILFSIGRSEEALFVRYQDVFHSWGISYDIEKTEGTGNGQSALIYVHTLPTLIAERCRTEPNLLLDLLRGEMWKWEESGIGPVPREDCISDTDRRSGVEYNGGGWIERTKRCPQGIMDLINSRACRSAIMFNDELTVDESQGLVSRLANCRFPFQCAHGRPSMVPILEFGKHDGDDSDDQGDFMEAFRKQWQ